MRSRHHPASQVRERHPDDRGLLGHHLPHQPTDLPLPDLGRLGRQLCLFTILELLNCTNSSPNSQTNRSTNYYIVERHTNSCAYCQTNADPKSKEINDSLLL